MQLLIELLQRNEDRALFISLLEDIQLFEDLGNLKALDPEFIKHLKDQIYIGGRGGRDVEAGKAKAEKEGKYYSEYDQKKYTRVKDALGKDSEVKETGITKGGEMTDALKDKNIRAAILKYDGKQVLALIREGFASSGRHSSSDSYKLVASKILFDKFIPEEEYDKIRPRAAKSYQDNFSVKSLLHGTGSSSIGKIRDIINIILKKAKEDKKEVKMLTVSVDQERVKKQTERTEARGSSKPYQTGNRVATGGGKYAEYDDLIDKYKKNLFQDFRDRLQKFKAGKAEGANTVEDLLKLINEKGYLDKMKFMGFTYQLHNSRNMDISSFKELEKGKVQEHSMPHIEYQHDSHDPEIDRLRKELDKLKADRKIGDKEAEEAYYEEREKLLPPRELKVMLGLKGGSIIPMAIQVGKEKSWIY